MYRETAAAIADAAGKEIETTVTVTMTEIVTEIVTETVAVTEAAIVTMIATEAVTATETVIETAAATEDRKQDRLPLLQIPADVRKSLFHNRLFSLDNERRIKRGICCLV